MITHIPIKVDPNCPNFGLVEGPVPHKQHPNQQKGLDLYVRVINLDTGEECFKKCYQGKSGLYFKHTGYSNIYISDLTRDAKFYPNQWNYDIE